MISKTSRRRGFTIVELLVAMALIILIMAVLSEAFVSALSAFRSLKGIGDMQERLRNAAVALRKDLALRHLEGDRKLSEFEQYYVDPSIGIGYQGSANAGVPPNVGGRPGQGFFRIQTPPNPATANPISYLRLEGLDGDGLPSWIIDPNAPLPVLHFAAKLVPDRKDALRRDQLFTTAVPASTAGNSFIDLVEGPPDFRQPGVLNSPWAEIAWFLAPTGETAGGGIAPLFALYRRQRIMIAPRRDSFLVTPATANPPGGGVQWTGLGQYSGVAVEPDPTQNLLLWITEGSVAEQPYVGRAVGRSMNFQPTQGGVPVALQAMGQWFSNPIPVGTQAPQNGFPTGVQAEPATLLGDDLITTDLLSLEIKVLRPGDSDFRDLSDPAFLIPNGKNPPIPAYTDPLTGMAGTYDTATTRPGWLSLRAIKITLRVWDFKTNQARQITVIQDL